MFSFLLILNINANFWIQRIPRISLKSLFDIAIEFFPLFAPADAVFALFAREQLATALSLLLVTEATFFSPYQFNIYQAL